jgi:hypothetical protein
MRTPGLAEMEKPLQGKGFSFVRKDRPEGSNGSTAGRPLL